MHAHWDGFELVPRDWTASNPLPAGPGHHAARQSGEPGGRERQPGAGHGQPFRRGARLRGLRPAARARDLSDDGRDHGRGGARQRRQPRCDRDGLGHARRLGRPRRRQRRVHVDRHQRRGVRRRHRQRCRRRQRRGRRRLREPRRHDRAQRRRRVRRRLRQRLRRPHRRPRSRLRERPVRQREPRLQRLRRQRRGSADRRRGPELRVEQRRERGQLAQQRGCGMGPELAFLLAPWLWLRRRGRSQV